MESDRLKTIRGDYDLIARDYAIHIGNELQAKPFDREILNHFAHAVAGRGRVCELGCGPGHVSRFLRDCGSDVFGLDLSPRMVEEARRLNPGIEFGEGNMLALDLPTCSLFGIVAFYSIVNIPQDSLPAVFAEMYRVLQPQGLALIAFHAGDEVLRPTEQWGQPISMEFFHHPALKIEQLLRHAGFAIDEVRERGPYAPDVEYQSNRAYIKARKSDPTAP
jgi:SAM-dependent methyltransferase